MVTVKINGKEITVDDGTLILNAARDAGFEVPTFCYQADLMGIGSCRMCLVEIEGQKKLQPSCVTPVLHGMSINTESQSVVSARAGVLEFLLANHALDCPVCDKGGECELQDMVYKYGPHKGRHAEPKFKFHEKDYVLSPVIIKNSNRCVQCVKCVRVCREVVGANVLTSLNRGDHQEETSFLRSFLDCDQDGNCIEVCPVGCFMRLPYRYKARPWDLKSADTVCPYCATGCRMVIEHRDGLVVRARAQLGVGINSETLCARGRFGFDFINSPARLTTPLVRKRGALEPASWEEAIALIRENFAAADGDRVAGIASPRLVNEELYLFQKLFRTIFKSANIDSSSRWDAGAVEGFVSAASMAGGGVSIFDCMASDTLLIIGGQLSDENPVTDYIARRISAGRRMNVVIASPRAMKLDSSATQVLRHSPGAEGALIEAIILNLNYDRLPDETMKTVKDAQMESLLSASGTSGGEIEAVAQRLAASSTVAVIAGTEFLRAPQSIPALGLLKDLLRSRGKKVTVLPALDRCNQRGAWEMGVHPGFGPGYSKADKKGLGCGGMLDAAERGELDALYIAGSDVVSMHPDAEFAERALSAVKFLVVQDMFLTGTARLAHVVLPGASFAEKEGMFTNQEGRAQIIRKLLPPPGKAKRDFDIIRAVGESFDPSFGPKNPALVLDEIRKEAPMYGDVSLVFNNRKNIEDKLDNRAALVKGAPGAALAISRFSPPEDLGGAGEFPFRLVTGNHLFHSGMLSRMSPSMTGLLSAAVVEISEEDAGALGLKDGDRVKVRGEAFEARMAVRARRGTRKGVAFVAENFEDAPVNRFFRRGKGAPRVSITKE